MLPRRVLRLASRLGFVIVAALLLLSAAYRLSQMWLIPEVTIGLAEHDTEQKALFAELARVADPSNLKIRILPFESLAAVAAALDAEQVDFAVVRPDVALPRKGLSTAILSETPIVAIRLQLPDPKAKTKAKPQSGGGAKSEDEKASTDIQASSRPIAILAEHVFDRDAIARLLESHGIPESDLMPVASPADELRSAVIEKKIDTLVTAASAAGLRRLVQSLAEFKPTVIALDADTQAVGPPQFGQATIAAKSLGSGVPAEEVKTASLSLRLMAGKNVERAEVSALLQALFTNRLTLGHASGIAWQMTGLETDDATYAKLPNHRGAVDYYNREQQTFMDLYGDWLWLGLFAAGGVSSAIAWLIQVLSRRRKELVENILDRLLEILSEARQAADPDQLNELTLEVDGLVTHAVRQARWRAADPATAAALTLAIDSSRAAIRDRRLVLAQRDKDARAG